MHIGRNGKDSKTECVFFLPPQFIATKVSQLTLIAAATTTTDMIDTVTSPTDIPIININTPTDFLINSSINIINHPKHGGKHGIVRGHTEQFATVEISDMTTTVQIQPTFLQSRTNATQILLPLCNRTNA